VTFHHFFKARANVKRIPAGLGPRSFHTS
jgi:hypothetical protein